MDSDEFKKKYFPKQFKDNFKVQLCQYNLVEFGIPFPEAPPATFADCILNIEDAEKRRVYPQAKMEQLFSKESGDYKMIESYLTNWQEGLLKKVAAQHPELAYECNEAIRKIHEVNVIGAIE